MITNVHGPKLVWLLGLLIILTKESLHVYKLTKLVTSFQTKLSVSNF